MSEIVKQLKEHIESANRANNELKTELNSLKTKVDPLSVEKIERIELSLNGLDSKVDELTAKFNLSSYTTGSDTTDRAEEDYSNVFYNKILRSKGDYNKLTTAELNLVKEYTTRAFAGGDLNNADGGHLVPTGDTTLIETQVRALTPIMTIADVQDTTLRQPPVLIQTTNMDWVVEGETSAQSNTTTPQIQEVRYSMGDYEVEPWITEDLLEDAEADLRGFVTTESVNGLVFKLGRDSILAASNADGLRGILAFGASAATPAYTQVSEIDSTVVSAATNNPLVGAGGPGFSMDDLYSVIYDIDSRYVNAAGGITIGANRFTLGKLRRLKDNQGQYLWQPPVQIGQPATFDGFRVVEFPNMPTTNTADTDAFIIGNFMSGYAVRRHSRGVKVLLDNLTNKKYLKVYSKYRYAGGLKDGRALRILRLT